MVAVFGREGQTWSEKVLEAGSTLVGKIEPSPLGGESQVIEHDTAAGECVREEPLPGESGELPASQDVAAGHGPAIMVDGQVQRQFQKQFVPSLEPAPSPHLVREEMAVAEDGVEGLDLGAGGAEAAVGDTVAGEDGLLPGSSGGLLSFRGTGTVGRRKTEQRQKQDKGDAAEAREISVRGQWQVAPSSCAR